jgi:iron transport multicopper oxidase
MYSVDDETTIITLADWYDQPTKQSIPCVPPSATLINGLGRPWCNTVSPGYGTTGCGTDGPSTIASPLSVVSVTQGTSYRFRIISLSCQPAFQFSIDNHNLTIIEADGQLHKPYTVDTFTIYAGQRYSAVVTANQKVGNYWIRAQPIIDGLSGYPTTFTNGINSAILRYSGAPTADPTSNITPGKNPLVESKLVPYSNPAAPGGADVNAVDVYKLNLDFSLVNYNILLNGVNRTLPTSSSVLSQIMAGNTGLVSNPMYFSLPANSVIQLSFPAGDTGPDDNHPIHLHGTAFSVIRSAGQSTYNFVNPPRRDVVNTGVKGDNVTIRFTTGNSGTWALYCTEPFHSTAGMEAVLYVRSLDPRIYGD